MKQLPWGKLAALGLVGGGAALTATGVGAPIGLGMMGAGAGLGKREWVDKPREARQLALAAETQRLSPWTGLMARMPEETSGFENALQGGVAGAQLGQSFAGTAPAGQSAALDPQTQKEMKAMQAFSANSEANDMQMGTFGQSPTLMPRQGTWTGLQRKYV
jgi:hypothetical protein